MVCLTLFYNCKTLFSLFEVLWAEGKDIGQGIDAVPHPNPKSDKKKKILPFGPERSRVAPSDSLGEESPKPLDSSVFMGESVHVVEETTGEKRMLPPEVSIP